MTILSISKKAVGLLAVALFVGVLASCAPSGVSDNGSTGSAKEGGTFETIEWTVSSDCGTCHVDQVESRQNLNCLYAKHASMDCVQCHTDETALKSVHDNAKSTSPALQSLRKTAVDSAVCEVCHGTWEELAEKTADVSLLTDSNGTVVNPHEVVTVVNVTGQHDGTTCVDCHEVHVDEGVDVTAPRYCQSCHHMDVYECNTCHEAA